MSLTWTSINVPVNGWSSVTYGNGLFVAVSNSLTSNIVMTSVNGINWTTSTSAGNISWRSVTYGNGLFVATSDTNTGKRAMTSVNGINWTLQTTPANNNWYAVTYGNGLFVAVSQNGVGNRAMASPDGINWTIGTTVSDYNWVAVTYGNGLFVAVSATTTPSNRAMTSVNGINWTLITPAANNSWKGVTYGQDPSGNGLFVAVSDTGTNRVMTSLDGINWISRMAAAQNNWVSVTYGNGLFVAVADASAILNNRVMTSPDGINWTIGTSAGGANNNTWVSVTSGNGSFVAVSPLGTDRVMIGEFSIVIKVISFPCFKVDTKILTDKGYILIQDLRKGDFVKTLRHGYKAITLIGKRNIFHSALKERIKDQLYKCSQTEYPDLFESLIITGCHSILVENSKEIVNEEQIKKIIEINGNIFLTDDKLRLPACVDEKTTVYEIPGNYTIYHLALEHQDKFMNYGIYANGLLVESCSERTLKELSFMTLIE